MKRIKIYLQVLLIGILSLIQVGFLFAQNDNIVFERLNTSRGLDKNECSKLVQDSKGYLWVGTADGLNKYDGYNFTTYRNDPQDTNSISNNSVWDILEDKSGNLWVSTKDGLNYFNLDKESFKTFNYTENHEGWANSSISLFEDDDENIWFGTVRKGISKFNPKTEKFIHFLPDSTGLAGENSNAAV